MKLKVFKTAKRNTTYLQGFGHVEGTPAGELKVGSTMIWNNGTPSTVVEIIKETDKMITVLEKYEDRYSDSGFSTYVRRLLKSRIVARPANELPGNEEPESDPSDFATSSLDDDRPSDDTEYPTEAGSAGGNDVVLITEGPEVDLVTELFDNAGNATVVENDFLNNVARMLSETENPEEDFDRLAAAFSPAAPKNEEPKPDDPEYYPNQVTFDRVLSLYPGGKVVGVEEFYRMNIGWTSVESIVGTYSLQFWNPEELVQYLKDKFEAVSFALIVEDKDGRRKNPDYKYRELVVGLEPGDAVLYLPDWVRGDRSNPSVERGIVSSIRVVNGRASVWVRYTTGETGVLTNLSNLVKDSCSKSCSPSDFTPGGKCDLNGCL